MNQHISRIINHPLRVPVVAGAVSFVGGAAFGYFLGKRRGNGEVLDALTQQLELDFNLKENDVHDIHELKVGKFTDVIFDSTMNDPNVPVDVESDDLVKPPPVVIDESDLELILNRQEVVENNEIDEVIMDEPAGEPEVITTSVFAGNDDEWDYNAEVAKRTETEPYVIHKDEFFADEKDYLQTTVTWYEGDSIMADQEESPIYNHQRVIGERKFGHGSGDQNVFYVRNDRLRTEYEVVRHTGIYSEEVMGMEIEHNQRTKDLRHSAIPKFNRED